MAEDLPRKGRSFSRREFLTLAGAGAVVGAFILMATQQKGIRGLLNSATSPRTNSRTNTGTNAATAGKFIQAGPQLGSTSWLQRILGGKL